MIHDLKKRYTVVIVTPNRQHVARVSDEAALMTLENLVEPDRTAPTFAAPADKPTEVDITGRFG